MASTRVLRNHINNQPIASKSNFGAVKGQNRPVLGDITGGQRNVIQNLGKLNIAPEKKNLAKNVPGVDSEKMEIDLISTVCESALLPPGVTDIDTKDLDNPQLCAEYATETYVYLRHLEAECGVRSMHLAGMQTNEKMRGVLVDWLVEVTSQFKLLQETLHSTVDILDRFMQVEGKSIGRSRLQLVGVASMFLAAKIEEMYAPACADFVYITDNAYTEAEIKSMELRIAKALAFRLSQPVSLNFLRRNSKAGDVDILQHNLAKYFLESTLMEYSLAPVYGSKLAAASLCLSLLVTDPSTSVSTVWTPTLAFYSGYSMEEVLPYVKKIANIVVKAAKAPKLQAIKTKYKSGKFMRVSDMKELKDDVMIGLANSNKI